MFVEIDTSDNTPYLSAIYVDPLNSNEYSITIEGLTVEQAKLMASIFAEKDISFVTNHKLGGQVEKEV